MILRINSGYGTVTTQGTEEQNKTPTHFLLAFKQAQQKTSHSAVVSINHNVYNNERSDDELITI